MSTAEQRAEKRKAMRVLLTNKRPLYDAIADAARVVTATVRRLAPELNAASDSAAPLVVTREDWRDLLDAVLAEVRELSEWETVESNTAGGSAVIRPQ